MSFMWFLLTQVRCGVGFWLIEFGVGFTCEILVMGFGSASLVVFSLRKFDWGLRMREVHGVGLWLIEFGDGLLVVRVWYGCFLPKFDGSFVCESL